MNFIIHRIECAHCGIYFVHIDCKTESVPIVTLFRFDMLRQLYMTPSKQMKKRIFIQVLANGIKTFLYTQVVWINY